MHIWTGRCIMKWAAAPLQGARPHNIKIIIIPEQFNTNGDDLMPGSTMLHEAMGMEMPIRKIIDSWDDEFDAHA